MDLSGVLRRDVLAMLRGWREWRAASKIESWAKGATAASASGEEHDSGFSEGGLERERLLILVMVVIRNRHCR